MKGRVVHAQLPAVQPHEIGGVRGIGLDFRDVFPAVVHHKVKVVREVGQQLLQPLLPLVEGRLHGGEGEGVVPVDIHPLPEAVKDRLAVQVRKNHRAGLESRQVEGFRAGNAGYNVVRNFRREGRHGGVFLSMEDKIGVNFVREQCHVVFHAQLRHPPQLLRRPDQSQGVVGIAEQEQVCLAELGLEVLPVHHPAAVPLHELVLQHRAAPGLGHVVKLGIDRRLDQHIAALRSEQAHGGGNGLHHPQAEAHSGWVDLPAVPALLPAPDGLEVAVRPGGVAPKSLLRPGGEGVNDGLGSLEVHVRNPQRDHVLSAEFFLSLVVFGGAVSGAVDDLIKIVLHSHLFLSSGGHPPERYSPDY